AALVALKGGLQFQQQLLEATQSGTNPIPIKGSRKSTSPNTPVYTDGEFVIKVGRQTNKTRGKIDTIVVIHDHNDDAGLIRPRPPKAFGSRSADPNDPIFAEPGDSGSVIVGESDGKVIGVLWGILPARDTSKQLIA